jgi:predicted transcriptional regulator
VGEGGEQGELTEAGFTMPTDRREDLHAFRAFIDAHLADVGATLTPAEALALWEIQNPTDLEREETLTAIRQGLEDADEGRVRPIEEFDRDFRRRHGLLRPE